MRPVLPFLIALGLAGCASPFNSDVFDPFPAETPPVVEQRPERSQGSFDVERHFANVEQNLTVRGLLRTDGGGPDVPFTDEMLARNFLVLAFSEEFSGDTGRLIQQSTDSVLHRWIEPVQVQTVFDPSIDPDQARADRTFVENYVERLDAVVGHPISNVAAGGNFTVLFMNNQSLRSAGNEIWRYMPELPPSGLNFVENLPLNTYCVVFASDPRGDGAYRRALTVIRAELPDSLRKACIHEEIAQGLGLSNDSQQARPSIFNDDDEFGRLTTMDELLLEMLYHPSLTVGMDRQSAEPFVRRIATDLMLPNG